MLRSLLKKLKQTSCLQSFVAYLIYLYLKLVYKTSRWRFSGEEYFTDLINQKNPFVVCFWHGHLLMLAFAWRMQVPFYMLISNHSDGKIISKVMDLLKIKVINGSTNKNGMAAARQLVRILQNGGVIGITPDGPRGPRHKASPGVITISKLAKAKIVPIAWSASPIKILGSWDRLRFAVPFSTGVFVIAEPLDYSLADIENVTDALNNTVAIADELV